MHHLQIRATRDRATKRAPLKSKRNRSHRMALSGGKACLLKLAGWATWLRMCRLATNLRCLQSSCKHQRNVHLCTNVERSCPSAVLVSADTKFNQHLFNFIFLSAFLFDFYHYTDSVSELQHLHLTQPCHLPGQEMGCCPHFRVGVSICHMQGHLTRQGCECRCTGRLHRL